MVPAAASDHIFTAYAKRPKEAVLVWEDRNGAVSVSYNSPGFLAERHHVETGLRVPFDAVESLVEAVVGP